MAVGDDALAAGYPLVLGSSLANTLDTEDNLTRDIIAQKVGNAGDPIPVSLGGTGAATAANARSNIGANNASNLNAGTVAAARLPNTMTVSNIDPADGGLEVVGGLTVTQNTELDGDVEVTGDVNVNGGIHIASGAGKHLYLDNAVAAVSGYTVAYINGPDGRLSKGASSRRFKKAIRRILPASLGNLFPPLSEFEMKGGDGKRFVGYIAEDLVGTDADRFVVYDNEGQVESVEFIGFLLAQNAQLNERLKALEG